jgi:hypothetical protein
MGHWGVRSYENDDAGDALDAGFLKVHGQVFEDMMDDNNPLSPDQVFAKLASPATLEASLAALEAEVEQTFEAFDEAARLAYAGIVVRHVELMVSISATIRDRALVCLTDESIEWEEATTRRLRRDREIRTLREAVIVE